MSQIQEKLDINLSDAIERMLGDADLVYLVLFHFRAQIKEELPIMYSSVCKEDFHTLFERVHALKGAAAIAGSELIYENLVELQKACKDQDVELSTRLLGSLQGRADSFIDRLNYIEGFTEVYGKEENFSY